MFYIVSYSCCYRIFCFLVTGRTALKRHFDAVAVHTYLPVTAALHAPVASITDYVLGVACVCIQLAVESYEHDSLCAYLEATQYILQIVTE